MLPAVPSESRDLPGRTAGLGVPTGPRQPIAACSSSWLSTQPGPGHWDPSWTAGALHTPPLPNSTDKTSPSCPDPCLGELPGLWEVARAASSPRGTR